MRESNLVGGLALVMMNLFESIGMLHPQLLGQGLRYWVWEPVARFSSEVLRRPSDLFKTIDLPFLYQHMLQIRLLLAQNRFRVHNAYEDGMLIENVIQSIMDTQSCYFTRSRGFYTHDEAAAGTEMVLKFWYQFVLTGLRRHYPDIS